MNQNNGGNNKKQNGGLVGSVRPTFSIVNKNKRKQLQLQRQNSWQAWASRVTAPFVKLDLVVECQRLPKKDSFSDADAFCGIWEAPMGFVGGKGEKKVSGLPTKQEREVGRTEVVRENKSPKFTTTFRLEYKFQEEQTYILRVYDEDLRYATDLKEHDFIGGAVFTLGELMGGAGCSIARPLQNGKAYAILTGHEIVEAREVLEFRFSGQDLGLLERGSTSKVSTKLKAAKDAAKDVLETMQKVNVAKTVLDKFDVFFRLEKLNPEDLTWSVVWKSEVVRDCQNPTWNVARIPLQLICDDVPTSPLMISIWVWNRFTPDELVGSVETTVRNLVEKAKRGIPVFDVMLEKKRFFGGTTQKKAGILKVLKSNILQIPSMVQYLSGGCELDLMVAVDCTAENLYWRDEDSLHYSSKSWLNDYQAVLLRIGSIFDAYEGSDFHMMGYGAKWHGSPAHFFQMGERVQNADDLVRAYDRAFSEEVAREKALVMQKTAELKHVIQAAMFRAVNANKNGRQCYSTLVILTTGVISDLQESIDAVCAAAEDAPLSIILIGIGKGDFEPVHKLVAGESANGVPIARDIMQFVSMSDFNGNARECLAEAFQNIQEQCVQHFTGSGVQPFPPKPVPDFTNEQIFGKSKKASSKTSKSRKRVTKSTC